MLSSFFKEYDCGSFPSVTALAASLSYMLQVYPCYKEHHSFCLVIPTKAACGRMEGSRSSSPVFVRKRDRNTLSLSPGVVIPTEGEAEMEESLTKA